MPDICLVSAKLKECLRGIVLELVSTTQTSSTELDNGDAFACAIIAVRRASAMSRNRGRPKNVSLRMGRVGTDAVGGREAFGERVLVTWREDRGGGEAFGERVLDIADTWRTDGGGRKSFGERVLGVVA